MSDTEGPWLSPHAEAAESPSSSFLVDDSGPNGDQDEQKDTPTTGSKSKQSSKKRKRRVRNRRSKKGNTDPTPTSQEEEEGNTTRELQEPNPTSQEGHEQVKFGGKRQAEFDVPEGGGFLDSVEEPEVREALNSNEVEKVPAEEKVDEDNGHPSLVVDVVWVDPDHKEKPEKSPSNVDFTTLLKRSEEFRPEKILSMETIGGFKEAVGNEAGQHENTTGKPIPEQDNPNSTAHIIQQFISQGVSEEKLPKENATANKVENADEGVVEEVLTSHGSSPFLPEKMTSESDVATLEDETTTEALVMPEAPELIHPSMELTQVDVESPAEPELPEEKGVAFEHKSLPDLIQFEHRLESSPFENEDTFPALTQDAEPEPQLELDGNGNELHENVEDHVPQNIFAATSLESNVNATYERYKTLLDNDGTTTAEVLQFEAKMETLEQVDSTDDDSSFHTPSAQQSVTIVTYSDDMNANFFRSLAERGPPTLILGYPIPEVKETASVHFAEETTVINSPMMEDAYEMENAERGCCANLLRRGIGKSKSKQATLPRNGSTWGDKAPKANTTTPDNRGKRTLTVKEQIAKFLPTMGNANKYKH